MMTSITLNDDRSERIRYDSPDYPVYIRRGLLSRYPDRQAPNHWHDDIEFILVMSGGMKYNINGVVTGLKKGEGLFVNSGQMHFGFSDGSGDCDFLCIILHPLLLCSVFHFERDFISPLIHNTEMTFMKLRPTVEWQNEILCELSLLYRNRKSAAAPMRTLSSFARIWAVLYEHAPADHGKETRQSQDLLVVKNMVGFIQKNYRQKITLAEIASAGAVGQSKCCRLFARYFAQSPNEYLNRYRLDKSLDLLRNTDLPVTDVAFSSGFGSGSYYAEMFRRMMGKSPTEYRRDCSYLVH